MKFLQFLSIAKGSCGETRSQSYWVFDYECIPRDELNDLVNGFTILSKKDLLDHELFKNAIMTVPNTNDHNLKPRLVEQNKLFVVLKINDGNERKSPHNDGTRIPNIYEKRLGLYTPVYSAVIVPLCVVVLIICR